jgi:hypothetical protein
MLGLQLKTAKTRFRVGSLRNRLFGWHSNPTGLVPTDASGPEQVFFIRDEVALFKGIPEVC